MAKLDSKYDVIVIGSGVGGLSCAVDLAKNGHKILVVEKHHTVGGYCSSFIKSGFYFDAGAHYLGSCRPEGQIGRLLLDHNLSGRIEFVRSDPSDIVRIFGREILLSPGMQKFLKCLQNQFPKEAAALEKFVTYIQNTNATDLYVELKNKTFRDVLDSHFKDEILKCCFAMLLGNIGLPSTRAAAVTSILLFKEFILDGGYYPVGGMQRFPDLLVKTIEGYGGVVSTLTVAESILLDSTSGEVVGCIIRQGRFEPTFIQTKVIVANCDPFQLFFKLLPERVRDLLSEYGFKEKRVSISAFMLYIGAKGDLASLAKSSANVWSYNQGSVDEYYERLFDSNELEYGKDGFVFCSLPSLHDTTLAKEERHSLQAIVGTPTFSKEYWEKHGERFASDVLERLESNFPGLSKIIRLVYPATPFTLAKYTGNHMGAMYGWASTTSQLGLNRFASEVPIGGLFVAGHWAGLPIGYSGVPLVVASGRNVAKRVAKHFRTVERKVPFTN